MRLTADFLRRFDWKSQGVTRADFIGWARALKVPPIRISDHQWKPLKEGRPVPGETVEAFSEYLVGFKKQSRFTVQEIAESCEAKPKRGRSANAWRIPWSEIFADVARNFSMPETSYCRDEPDVKLAARMVMVNHGFGERAATVEAALAVAERNMRRSLDDYAGLLATLWRADTNTVLFTVDNNGRVGVSVVAPLAEPFYRSFRAGGAEDMDIAAADLTVPSNFLLLDAVSDNPDIDVRQEKGRRSLHQARTVLSQIASLCPPLHAGNVQLSIITQAGNDEAFKRLQAYHYRPTGAATRRTNKEVWEFAKPDAEAPGFNKAYAQYLAMYSALMLYQAAIAGNRRLIGD